MTDTLSPPSQRVLGNVGVLDLRQATEASVASIERIGNVGTVLVSPETRHLVARISMGNLGATVVAPAHAKALTGQVVITRDYFTGQNTAESLVVAGQLLIRPDVDAAALRAGLDQLAVCGQLLCPETLVPIVREKLTDLCGVLQTYTAGMELVIGDLHLDAAYVTALADGSTLAVVGHLQAPEVLDTALLQRKLKEVSVIGKLSCREENVAAFRRVLTGPPPHIVAIPAGFTPVAAALRLDSLTLNALPGSYLYCPGRVLITDDVTSEQLEAAIVRLEVKGVLMAPASLRSALAARCDLLQTKALFYEGELWLVDDPTTLIAPRFDYLVGTATLVVQDTLTVAPEVEPRLLADRLVQVHNLGCIGCTPAQMAALQSRPGLKEGEFVDSTQPQEGAPATGIGNVGVLRL